MMFTKHLRSSSVALATLAVLALSGSVTTPGHSSTTTHVMRPAGYIVSQGHKGDSACPRPRVCYTPSLLQQAYDFPANLTGFGQTIVVVVAYGSPTISDDLAQFDSTFGIPAPPSFTMVPGISACGSGCGSGDTVGWGVETSATVEYAHAMAPEAAIVLLVSPTDDTSDIAATEKQLLPQFPGAIVSQSFGDDETDPTGTAQSDFQTLHDVFASVTLGGGSVLASAGDFGPADCDPSVTDCTGAPPVASYPASDPLVTGVGGTEGDPYPGGLLRKHGRYGNEQVWNEGDTFGAATGGAPSVLYADAPQYQVGITGQDARTVPDVAYNASINGGIQVYDSDPNIGGWITFGGTSAGVPQWAAILALADQARAAAGEASLGVANTALYAIAQGDRSYRKDFHDIRKGNNSLGEGIIGFKAGRGYDLATGLGTPDVANLIQDLVTSPSDHQGPDEHPHPEPGLPGPGGHHDMKPER